MDNKKIKIPRWKKWTIGILWSLFGLTAIGGIAVFILIYNGAVGYMPPLDELKNPTDKYASVIYSSDGKELGRFFSNTGNRVYADYYDISGHVIDALIATEDARYDEHSGIDVKAVGRAIWKTVIMGQKQAGGGSTITQQLAKQLYSPGSEGLMDRALQKPIEWMIALKLEKMFSKDEIIKMYLNQFDFLYNAVGIKSAAYIYFGKDAKDLNIEEAATLVGMVKNPSYYNPVRQNERTRERRNTVLNLMHKAGKLTKEERDSLQALPLVLDFHRVDHKDGLAPYFREELRRILSAKKPERKNYHSWEDQKFREDSIAWETNPLFGWVEKNPKPDGSKYDIYHDGLKIYTTIDSRMQEYAERAVDEHMKSLQSDFFKEKKGTTLAPYTTNRMELSADKINNLIERALTQTDRYREMKKSGATEEEIKRAFNTPREMQVFSYNGIVDTVMTPRDSVIYTKHFLRTGMMSMDPVTGHVKAYVGGPNFSYFQYDMVSTGRRQIGSTMKPFLYAYAMEEGYTPCDEFLNDQPVITDEWGNTWAPRNAGTAHRGEMVTLRWALTNSNNWISARLMSELSPATLVRNLHNFGITSKIDPVMSISLGSCEVSVKEMVGAYTAFANKGLRAEPVFVTEIADNDGNTISEFVTTHTDVLSEKAWYKINSILQNVVDGGTGGRLRRAPYNITANTGGKTGTTNFNADAWFMGFTPQLVTGVWVGGEDRYIHFNQTFNGQGAAAALPIYGKYMNYVYADSNLPYKQDIRFPNPPFDLCEHDYYGEFEDEVEETVEESISGAFD